MLDFASANKIKYVLFAGDFFDSRTSQRLNPLGVFEEFLSRAFELGITIYAIPGNHDKTLYNKKYSFISIFKHFPRYHLIEDTTVINIEGRNITFVPFFDDEILLKKLKESVGGDVLISHFEMQGSTNLGNTNKKSNITKKLLNKWNKVYLGHYHNTHEITKDIVHLPSLIQNDFGEDTNKGFTILYDDLSYEIIQSESKRYVNVEVDLNQISTKDLVKMKEKYEASNDAVKFKFTGSEAQIKALDKKQFKEAGITITCDYEVGEEIVSSEAILSYKTKEEIQEAFKEYCNHKKLDFKKWSPHFENFLRKV